MKKYKVEVTIIKEYEIEIDETIVNNEFIEEFECGMYPLDNEEDKYKAIANDVGRLRAIREDFDFEGYGFPLLKGKTDGYVKEEYIQKGINFTNMDENYIDIIVEEI